MIKRVDKDYVVVSSSNGSVERVLARHVVVEGGLDLDLALLLSDLESDKLYVDTIMHTFGCNFPR